MSQVQKESRLAVVVHATVEQVWDVVSDVTRVGEWSHECRSARWLGDAETAAVGARFQGRNRAGWIRWGRTCEIVTVEPPRRIAWRTVPTALFPDSTLWSIEVEPVDGHARIIQSFAVQRAPWLLDRIYAQVIPAHRDRDDRLTQDLERLGSVAGATRTA